MHMAQPWWQHSVVYHVYPRSFMDSTGDGVGDLAGITQQLDYLVWLEVDLIWLSPIYPSPMDDFGYDVADYTAIHPLFGSLDDFDTLVEAAHQRGLRVMIDFVPNHTSDQHPWFAESRMARSSPMRDWYVWRDAQADGRPPNNWFSVFGGSAWQWDATTAQYYLHSFLPSMPDLNWRNPAVEAALFDVVRFWLARGVDGMRIDTAHYIMKDALLRDNPPNPSTSPAFHRPMGAYDTQLHLYDKGDPEVHAVYRRLRRLLDDYDHERPRIASGEIHIFDWPVWARYYGKALDELHLPLNFGLIGVAWHARAVREVVDSVEQALPPGAWPNYVLSNHDESRLATRVGAAQARVGTLLLLTLRGTPTLYYGDELGMADVPIPPERAQDPWGKQVPGLGRDAQRTPMQWDASPNAGFSSPNAVPWLPLAADAAQTNAAVQQEDPRSMLQLTRSLLALRRALPALRAGTYRAVDGVPDNLFVYLRETGEQRVLVILNFADHPRVVQLPELGRGIIRLSTMLDRTGPIALAHVQVRGDESLVIQIEPQP